MVKLVPVNLRVVETDPVALAVLYGATDVTDCVLFRLGVHDERHREMGHAVTVRSVMTCSTLAPALPAMVAVP